MAALPRHINNNNNTSSHSQQRYKPRVMSLSNIFSVSCLLVAIVAVNWVFGPVGAQNQPERLAIEGRQQRESNEDLTATINYLENVDKYYSHLARPRFGRSEYKQQAYSGLPHRLAFGLPRQLEPSTMNPQYASLADLIQSRALLRNSNLDSNY